MHRKKEKEMGVVVEMNGGITTVLWVHKIVIGVSWHVQDIPWSQPKLLSSQLLS